MMFSDDSVEGCSSTAKVRQLEGFLRRRREARTGGHGRPDMWRAGTPWSTTGHTGTGRDFCKGKQSQDVLQDVSSHKIAHFITLLERLEAVELEEGVAMLKEIEKREKELLSQCVTDTAKATL